MRRDVFVAIRAVAAGGAAAITALKMPGFGEDHVGAFPVEVLAFLRCGARSELFRLVSHDRGRAARVRCLRMKFAIWMAGFRTAPARTLTGSGRRGIERCGRRWRPGG